MSKKEAEKQNEPSSFKRGIFVLNKDIKFIEVSRELISICGCSLTEMNRSGFFGYFGLESSSKIVKRVCAFLADPEELYVDFTALLNCGTGNILPVKVSLNRTSKRGHFMGVIENMDTNFDIIRFVQASPIPMLSTDANGIINSFNEYMEKLSGFKAKDIIGKKMYHELGKDSKIHREIFRKILKQGGYYEVVNKIYKKLDNSSQYLHIRMKGIVSESGETQGTIISLTDVTNRVIVEKALRESESRYKAIVENLDRGVIVMNLHKEIRFINKTATEMLGLENDTELLGQNITDFFHNDDRDRFINKFKTMLIGSSAQTGGSDYRMIRSDGENLIVSLSIVKVTDLDNAIGAQIVINDVTQKREAEKKLRQLDELNRKIIRNAPISILTLDTAGNITSVNDYYFKLSGTKDPVGKNIYTTDFFKKENLIEKYKMLLNEGRPFMSEHRETRDAEGKPKYLNIIAVPIRDGYGHIEGAISMATDITDAVIYRNQLKALNLELEKRVTERTKEVRTANKKLAIALELKSQFIADASHELRTPLTIIRGNLDLASREVAQSANEYPETYDAIFKEVERMTNVLSDLSVLTMADSSKMDFRQDVIYLPEMLWAMARSVKVLADKKKIKITVGNVPDLSFIGDSDKLDKLILNLVRNAIKYNHIKGYVKLSAKAENNILKIMVEDNGIGIPEKDLHHIFERFYRVDKARSRSEGGSGLGLAICKWIAETHGGNIEVESELGVGSKFTVNLPYDPEKVNKMDKKQTSIEQYF